MIATELSPDRLRALRTALGSYAMRLRLARTLANITREQLAARAGVSIEAIGALERGDRHPFAREAGAIAGALDISIEFFRASGVTTEALCRIFAGETDARARALALGGGA